jgi:hypothetical protein
MTQAHPHRVRGALRSLAGAAVCACLVASIGLVSSSAAEPAAAAAARHEDAPAGHMYAAMSERWSHHVQSHLDKLAGRLEIKASQEPAWQKFSAAFRDTMHLPDLTGRAAMSEGSRMADADAAALARQQAERARDHAQKLTALADATAALRETLDANQRLVLDEAARHFVREHGHGGMAALAEGGHPGAMGDHCEHSGWRGDGRGAGGPHGWERGAEERGSVTETPPGAPAQGEASH